MNGAKYGAVLAVTGASVRAERLDRLGGDSRTGRIERMIRSFGTAGVQSIAVVVRGQKKLIRHLQHEDVIFLQPESGGRRELLDYVKMGLSSLKEDCEKIFVCPESAPFFTDKTVHSMMEQDAPLVIPAYRGERGHPVLLSSSLVDRIFLYQGEKGLAGAIQSTGTEPCILETEDPGVLSGRETAESIPEILKHHDTSILGPCTQVSLRGKNTFFGPDTLKLLRQVQRFGSVREACEKSGISYSKGWNMIRRAEEGLGGQILSRQAGGKGGGSASVTPRGQELMNLFEQYQAAVECISREKYQKLFLDSGFLGP